MDCLIAQATEGVPGGPEVWPGWGRGDEERAEQESVCAGEETGGCDKGACWVNVNIS